MRYFLVVVVLFISIISCDKGDSGGNAGGVFGNNGGNNNPTGGGSNNQTNNGNSSDNQTITKIHCSPELTFYTENRACVIPTWLIGPNKNQIDNSILLEFYLDSKPYNLTLQAFLLVESMNTSGTVVAFKLIPLMPMLNQPGKYVAKDIMFNNGDYYRVFIELNDTNGNTVEKRELLTAVR